MQRQTTAFVSFCVATAVAAISIASCGTSNTPPGSSQPGSGQPGSTAPSSSQPGASQPASRSAPATQPVQCTGGWRTGSLAVAKQVSVPPVPVATAARTGSHQDCKFDRLVIDISGPAPGYSVSFVRKVIQDASGRTVTMPGTRYLVIRLNPAQAHTAAGQRTLPTGIRRVNYPMLKGWTVSGDFEGVLSIALGLDGGTSYRVGELGSRIYVDVAW